MVLTLFKQPVSLGDLIDGKAMGDQWLGIDLSLRDQPQDLIAPDAVHAAGLEVKFFPYICGSGSS